MKILCNKTTRGDEVLKHPESNQIRSVICFVFLNVSIAKRNGYVACRPQGLFTGKFRRALEHATTRFLCPVSPGVFNGVLLQNNFNAYSWVSPLFGTKVKRRMAFLLPVWGFRAFSGALPAPSLVELRVPVHGF